MADSASESDSSSIDGGPIMMPPSPVTREQLQKRIESLQQQNRVLRIELDTYKLRVKALQEENKGLRQTSVNIQAKAEQEEEFISNTLMKQIQTLKKEKEALAHTFEQEEECLTNDLSRKLNKLKAEKCKLEQSLEQEQECLVNKLMRKIEKLEAETSAKQNNLEQLRREKVELENTLEQEQEALVNRLWKRMDKLEAEKRNLQTKVVTAMHGSQSGTPSSPFSFGDSIVNRRSSGGNQVQSGGSSNSNSNTADDSGIGSLNCESERELRSLGSGSAGHGSASGGQGPTSSTENDIITMTGNVQHLRNEVERLKAQLSIAQQHHTEKMSHFAMEEKQIREENLRLQRRLQLEMERREALCRHLSESESSLEMEDERHFHESLLSTSHGPGGSLLTGVGTPIPHTNSSSTSISGALPLRPRPGSSPGPSFVPSPGNSGRPMSPGLNLSCSGRDIMSPPSPVSRCHLCNGHGYVGGQLLVTTANSTTCFSQAISSSSPPIRHSNNHNRERFARPAPPSNERAQEPRTPGDSTMSSPSPSPAPLEIVMSPLSAPSPSPMDTSSKT